MPTTLPQLEPTSPEAISAATSAGGPKGSDMFAVCFFFFVGINQCLSIDQWTKRTKILVTKKVLREVRPSKAMDFCPGM